MKKKRICVAESFCAPIKIWRIMRLSLFFVLVCIAQVWATNSYSQQTRLTMNLSNVKVIDVLNEIEEKTEYFFLFNQKLVNVDRVVNVKVNQQKVEEVLSLLFDDYSIDYRIMDRQILLSTRNITNKNTKRTISGNVTNESGQPIPGATVVVKGTSHGVITDPDGNFQLTNVEVGQTIVISFLGMTTKEIPITIQTNLEIILSESTIGLDEVVAIGYGTMKKSDLTGAVASVKQGVLEQTKESSFIKSLQGRVAGVQIRTGSGEPGSGSKVIIRGANTIAGNSDPLYVIDGIQINESDASIASPRFGDNSRRNPLSSINPADIVSIEVLKDASSTAIYGSKGANGVILVTTRQGKKGEPEIMYDGSTGVSYPSRKIDVLNGGQWINYLKDWLLMPDKKRIVYGYFSDWFFFENAGETEPSKMIPRDVYALPEYNWQNEMYRTALRTTHSLSVSGGNQYTKYSASIGYNYEEGLLLNNDYSRYNANLKLNHSKKRIKLDFAFRSSYSRYTGAAQSGDGYNNMGILQTAVISRPLIFSNPLADETLGGWKAPTENLNHVDRITSSPNVSSHTSFNYKLLDGLYIGTTISGTIVPSRTTEFYGKKTPWGFYLNGRAAITNSEWLGWANVNTLSYEVNFKNNTRLNTFGAFELNGSRYENSSIIKSNFAEETTGVYDINKGVIFEGASSGAGLTRRASFLGRANYNMFDRYLITTSLRADGSDRFGEDNRWGYFPSFAVAWRVSEESFMKHMEQVDNLKLRLSYGRTGNSNIPQFRYMARMGNSFYNDRLGLVPSSMPNPSLKWETTVQYNAGLDLTLFKNSINLSGDIYSKQTTDMLYQAIIPAQSGFKSQWQNLGKIDNKGIELSINTHNVSTTNFDWTSGLTFSSNRNKVVEIGNGLDEAPIGAGYWSLSYIKINDVGRIMKDQPIGVMYGYEMEGIYQLDDFSGWTDKTGTLEPNDPNIPWQERGWILKPGISDASGIASLRPGTFKFKNLDGSEDMKITEEDKTIIGKSQPKFFGGLSNNFRFKQFELDLFFDYAVGGKVFNSTKFELEGAYYGEYYNITQDFWENRWTPDNPTNEYPTYSNVGYYNSLAAQPNSYFVEDASYLRLQNVSFSYRFSKSFTKRIGIKNLKLYYSASNLFTITSYSGFTPEIDSGAPLLSGFDSIGYPRATSHVLGINLTL
ncbi:TonB-dependent receptor [Sunxiuqinia elliptica]|uniref:TonB-linked SusC/RagA family outer membrane protein n=1 Tax=Sunxiuqinia elliptica TaxID=655355 RepID=A0A4V3BXJ2_9BACT|nr:TonB-dependent receptor [Sunxiuqinia elliptica]TDN99048.1 TonB-linked SusC/RagA family outer membrane protein [Sunxiuqinia elliptica]TDO56488.1 TonB-linked SusC/RagA family outer membrane protein [Sunxiuqinia elliptica]